VEAATHGDVSAVRRRFPLSLILIGAAGAALLVCLASGVGAAVPEVESNDTLAQATALAPVGTPLSAAFPPEGGGAVGEGTLAAGDVDVFAFDLVAGELVTLLVVTPDGGAVADPELALFGPGDAPLAQDDDAGPGLLPALRRRVAVSGTFKAAIQHFAASDAAVDYRLVVAVTTDPPSAPEPLPDDNDTAADADSVPPGGGPFVVLAPGEVAVVTGDVSPGDVDYYEVEVPAGRTLAAAVWDEDAGAFDDPVLGLFDGAGLDLGSDDDEGPGLDSAVASTPAGAGSRLRLAVSGYGDALFDGSHDEDLTYELVVALGPEAARVCDVDADGDVDAADVNTIFVARGTPVPPGDPRDVDGDGTITVLDSRTCADQCDDANCVSPSEPICGLVGAEWMLVALGARAWRRRRSQARAARRDEEADR
jgi:hypothetical protein